MVVDTDMGVDDAAAVAWLLAQQEHPVEIVGVSAVWGNTSVEDAAGNVVALLDALGAGHVPVVVGESAPLAGALPSRIGAIAHGPDGMWGCGKAARGAAKNRDLVGFYRTVVTTNPGATLLALGPLSNLARVLEDAPEVLRGFGAIVVLGGAKHEGSMTPVTETNFWHDPEAAERVLSARLPITMITRDAHRSFALGRAELDAFVDAKGRAARFLSRAALTYAKVTEGFGEGTGYPDVVAAMYAVDPSIATRVASALVKVVTGPAGLARGQSIIGTTTNERLTMVESGAALQGLVERMLGGERLDVPSAIQAILAREPDNAKVVLEIAADRVRSSFMHTLFPEDAT